MTSSGSVSGNSLGTLQATTCSLLLSGQVLGKHAIEGTNRFLLGILI